jgi:ABC-type nitrate/sulfonate/bicarbonate transport system substrate-binding protein
MAPKTTFQKSSPMKKLRIALDWTPNVNHIGFFVAHELGFYQNLGIDFEFLNPKDDDYSATPGKKLELDMADLAIAPFETVISMNTKANPVPVLAIYAILQEDLSSIVTLKSSNILTPKELDGKTYASYKARYEDHIVFELLKNDGGSGRLQVIYPNKLGIWNTLLQGKADATWIFDHWEGVEARNRGVELNHFHLNNFKIPYGYSPVILAKKNRIDSDFELLSHFIQATKKGFLYAKEHQKESAKILKNYVSLHELEHIPLEESISLTAPYLGDEETAGFMAEARVHAFANWLVQHQLEDARILSKTLFTNALLEK